MERESDEGERKGWWQGGRKKKGRDSGRDE